MDKNVHCIASSTATAKRFGIDGCGQALRGELGGEEHGRRDDRASDGSYASLIDASDVSPEDELRNAWARALPGVLEERLPSFPLFFLFSRKIFRRALKAAIHCSRLRLGQVVNI